MQTIYIIRILDRHLLFIIKIEILKSITTHTHRAIQTGQLLNYTI